MPTNIQRHFFFCGEAFVCTEATSFASVIFIISLRHFSSM